MSRRSHKARVQHEHSAATPRERRRAGDDESNAMDAAPPAMDAVARIDGIDALRAVAICLMVVYHFAFDLRFYGVTASNFEHDPFWLGFRALIVSLFMALAGVSLVLADRAGASKAHFWRRLAAIAACALAVTVASRVAFPRSFIYFGILHCIVVASVLASPFVRWPALAFVVGCVIVVAGLTLTHPAFDLPVLSTLGFVTHKPYTEDYVPLAPWAGVVFLGITLGHLLARDSFRVFAPLGSAPPWFRWLGRHSLFVYMVHQPVLLGVMWLALPGKR